MDLTTVGFAGVILFFAMIALRAPIAIAMCVTGLVGGLYVNGWSATMFVVGSLPFESVFPYGLSVVPLFVLMGTLALSVGVSRSMYDAGEAAFGHFRGGLSMSTIAACAGFGAICGSSLATSATMGRIAIPEMRGRGYDAAFSAATVAAGGTLGVLIPPSIILVIYALLTRESIGQLFVASLVPGLLATALYMATIAVTVRRNKALAPAVAVQPVSHRLRAFAASWHVIALFVVVLGGLFAGFFSPTESASVGVIGVLLIGAMKGQLSKTAIGEAVREAASLTGMIFLILIGASLFNYFIEATQITRLFVTLVTESGLERWHVIVAIIVLYLVLGCFMDSISMIFLTLPFVFPIVQGLDFDTVWFGVLLLSVVEIGLITPPVGMNLFIVRAAAPELNMNSLYRAIAPFLVADGVRLFIVAAFPAVSLTLVRLIYG